MSNGRSSAAASGRGQAAFAAERQRRNIRQGWWGGKGWAIPRRTAPDETRFPGSPRPETPTHRTPLAAAGAAESRSVRCRPNTERRGQQPMQMFAAFRHGRFGLLQNILQRLLFFQAVDELHGRDAMLRLDRPPRRRMNRHRLDDSSARIQVLDRHVTAPPRPGSGRSALP